MNWVGTALSHFQPIFLLHIPDGFLSLPVCLVFWIITFGLLAVAVRRTKADLGERQVPLMGLMAAFIFAAQMINLPVGGGTSGHLIGGALAAITLGPWAAVLVMAAVLGVQALLFQDGGLLVLGANVFNMGFLTAMVAFGLYRTVVGRGRVVKLAIAGIGAWLSVMVAALSTSLQLVMSGTSPVEIVLPAMLAVHVVFGLIESVITVAALAFLFTTRPELVDSAATAGQGGRGWIIGGVATSLALVLLAPLASSDPDGLEAVAGRFGFADQSLAPYYELLPDYQVPGLTDSPLSTVLAGLVGLLVVAALVLLAARTLNRRSPTPAGE